MFKNTFQSGFLSILYSIGSKPLQIWDKKVRNGHIKRITDNDIQSLVLEVIGSNVSTTYITCPADPKVSIGILDSIEKSRENITFLIVCFSFPENLGHQIALFSDDYQEFKEIFYVWSTGKKQMKLIKGKGPHTYKHENQY